MNPSTNIEFPKNQYKKFIKDVVNGTIERSEIIEETITKYLNNDIDLKTDKLLKIIFFLFLSYYSNIIIQKKLL